MVIIILAVLTIVAVVVARVLLGGWLNHLSLYSLLWGSCLILEQARLIRYSPISGLAWFYVLTAWFMLYLGTATVLWIPTSTRAQSSTACIQSLSRLKLAIWVLSLSGAVSVIYQGYAVLNRFDSLVDAVFSQANTLYHLRAEGTGLSGMSYIGALPGAACSLAGMFSARMGRITLTAVLPLVLVTLSGVLMMGRANLILAGVWFLVAFFYTPRKHLRVARWKVIVTAVLISSVLVIGFALVSTTRGLSVDYPVSPSMERASGLVPILPSLYFYYTGPLASFSQYLDHPESNVNSFWGMNTFAPVYRLCSHFGAPTAVPVYAEFYYAPVAINVNTYLKDLHSDFGAIGVVLFPYMLGALITWVHLGMEQSFSSVKAVILAHLYLIVLFSFVENVMQQGVWYLSLSVAVLLAWCYVDRKRADGVQYREAVAGSSAS